METQSQQPTLQDVLAAKNLEDRVMVADLFQYLNGTDEEVAERLKVSNEFVELLRAAKKSHPRWIKLLFARNVTTEEEILSTKRSLSSYGFTDYSKFLVYAKIRRMFIALRSSTHNISEASQPLSLEVPLVRESVAPRVKRVLTVRDDSPETKNPEETQSKVVKPNTRMIVTEQGGGDFAEPLGLSDKELRLLKQDLSSKKAAIKSRLMRIEGMIRTFEFLNDDYERRNFLLREGVFIQEFKNLIDGFNDGYLNLPDEHKPEFQLFYEELKRLKEKYRFL